MTGREDAHRVIRKWRHRSVTLQVVKRFKKQANQISKEIGSDTLSMTGGGAVRVWGWRRIRLRDCFDCRSLSLIFEMTILKCWSHPRFLKECMKAIVDFLVYIKIFAWKGPCIAYVGHSIVTAGTPASLRKPAPLTPLMSSAHQVRWGERDATATRHNKNLETEIKDQ